jgi:hypothetical protein
LIGAFGDESVQALQGALNAVGPGGGRGHQGQNNATN